MNRLRAIISVFLDYLPNLLFTIIFGSIFISASFKWMFDYTPADILSLPLSIALALCFYLSPAFCRPPKIFKNIRILADIDGYELVGWGGNSYSVLKRGGAGLVLVFICFFKNILLIPFCVIKFIIGLLLAIICPDFCCDNFANEEFPTGILLYVLILITLTLSVIPLIITVNQYNAQTFENNIILQCTYVEKQNKKVDTDFGETYNVITLSFDFETNAPSDLQYIYGYLIITDGNIQLRSSLINIISGYNNVRFNASNQYADISYDKYLNYQNFNNINLNNLSITVFVRQIKYKDSSITHSFSNYQEYSVELTNKGRDVNELVYNLLSDGTYSITHKYDGIKILNCPEYYNNKKVTQIGRFYDCSELEEVHLSNTITTIQGLAFWDCTSLKSIIIPDSVIDIGISAFENCSSLKSLTLSKNITDLSTSVFQNCSSLKEITIPKTVVRIDKYALSGCSSLTIHYEGSVAQWNNIWKGSTWCYLTYGVVDCNDGTIPIS